MARIAGVTRQVDACPRCGESGVLLQYMDGNGQILQIHCAHEVETPCQQCGRNHVTRSCVLQTWPPTPWMHTQLRFHDPNGPLPPSPDPRP